MFECMVSHFDQLNTRLPNGFKILRIPGWRPTVLIFLFISIVKVPFIYYVLNTYTAQTLIWLPIFFVKTEEFLFQHYILTKFSCCVCILKFLVHKEKILKTIVKMLWLIEKCLRNIWMFLKEEKVEMPQHILPPKLMQKKPWEKINKIWMAGK